MWAVLAVVGLIVVLGGFAHALCRAAGEADDALEMAIEEERRRHALAEQVHAHMWLL